MNKFANTNVMSWWWFFIKNKVRISRFLSLFELICQFKNDCKNFIKWNWLFISRESLLFDKQIKLFQHLWQFKILKIFIDCHLIIVEKHEKFRIDCNQTVFNWLRFCHFSNFILHDIHYRFVSFFIHDLTFWFSKSQFSLWYFNFNSYVMTTFKEIK